MKEPHNPASFIPVRTQTLAAPMSYALHHELLGPEGFDWQKLREEVSECGHPKESISPSINQ